MANRRVVITGIGWVTPLGHDVPTVWGRVLKGECGIAPTERFDASTFPTQFSAQVKGYDYRKHVKHQAYHEGVGFNTGYALGAAAHSACAAYSHRLPMLRWLRMRTLSR